MELQLIQHEEGRVVKDEIDNDWEYQYHLKDHLGNTRVSFTTKPKTLHFKTGYENDPADIEDDYDLFEAISVSETKDFNRTTGSYSDGVPYSHSQILRSSTESQIGSAISISVGPGDKITASVFAKYVGSTENNNIMAPTLAAALIGAFTGSPNVGNIEGGVGTVNSNFGESSLIGGAAFPYDDANAPKAFLNIMFLPDGPPLDLVKDVTFAYDQITNGATEAVINGVSDSPFDVLIIENFEVKQKGYILVYLSNEGSLTDVYFDDLDIEVNETPIIQKDDYYPFGLTFNSYQRVTTEENGFKYNGKELMEEIGLYDYGARYYDPAIARFIQVDPMAEERDWLTPYNYVQNNPILRIDPTGMIDDYYGIVNDELVYLGSDGQGDNIRLVNEGQHEQTQANLNGENTTDAQRETLRSGDVSQTVTFNEGSVQTELQGASDRTISSGLENSAIITLDPATATVDAQAGAQGTNTNVTNTVNTYGSDGQWTEDGSRLVIGIAHGHPTTQTPGQVNAPGYSAGDSQTAGGSVSPTYSIDSYSSTVGGAASIHQARPGGTSGTNPVGTTQNTNNIGRRSFLGTARRGN